MHKFKKRVLEVDLYGERLEIQVATVKQRIEYQKKVAGLDPAKAEDSLKMQEHLLDLMEEAGLAKDTALDMHEDDLTELTRLILGRKKK